MQYSDDRQLVRLLLDGDEAAFTRFFDDYFPRLYRFALSRMRDHEQEIQDIVQTTLMKAIKSLATYRGEAALFTWLCQILRNEINSWYRAHNRHAVLVPEDDASIRGVLEDLSQASEDEPGQLYQRSEVQRVVQAVLDHLPVGYGDVLEWKYIKGWSVAEIADSMGVSHLAAQSTLSRARSAFRQAIEAIDGIAGTDLIQGSGGTV